MKRFFRFASIGNACGIAVFILDCIYLFFVWQLISSGSLFAQCFAVLCMAAFLCSAVCGVVYVVIDLIRWFAARKNIQHSPK